MAEDELRFGSSDVISVLFMEDDHWWWGMRKEQTGWFPASYVRVSAWVTAACLYDFGHFLVFSLRSGREIIFHGK